MKIRADMSKLTEPQSLDYLLEDPDFRAGFEEAGDARESAEVIAYWRDHDRVTGRGITNAELARRLKVKPARISALLRPAAKPSNTGYGPSYTLLKRICRATGRTWPEGLTEALSGNRRHGEDAGADTSVRRTFEAEAQPPVQSAIYGGVRET